MVVPNVYYIYNIFKKQYNNITNKDYEKLTIIINNNLFS